MIRSASDLNGLALSGIRPYGSSFLIFSDYMKPPIRLSALMGLPVVHIFTHDSISLRSERAGIVRNSPVRLELPDLFRLYEAADPAERADGAAGRPHLHA